MIEIDLHGFDLWEAIDEIIYKVLTFTKEDGILKIFEIDRITRTVEPFKDITIIRELEFCPN